MYVYVETSAGNCDGPDNTAILNGTSFEAGTVNTTISFWYHMYGNGAGEMGDLALDVFDGSNWILDVWEVSGEQQVNQGDPYLQAIVDLSSYRGIINLRFRYDNMLVYRGDIALDDIEINVTSLFNEKLSTTTITPLWTNSSNPQTISLNENQSQIVDFYINATGNIGERYPLFVEGNILSGQGYGNNGSLFNVSIADDNPPLGNKLSPLNDSLISTRNVTFRGNASDDFGLGDATLKIWYLNTTLYYEDTIDLGGALNSNYEFNYSFSNNGNYTWNILLTDIGGNQYWLDNENWTINMLFPDIDINFVNLNDNFFVIQNNIENITVNVTCNDVDCGSTNISLYYIDINRTIKENFESGSINNSLWQESSSIADGRINVYNTATSICSVSAYEGNFFLGMDVDPSGTFNTNILKSVYDFSGYNNFFGDRFDISFYITDLGEENHQCSDHLGDFCNGEGFFYTCDGNQWYEIDYFEPTTISDGVWELKTNDLTTDPNFCSIIDSNFSIKFSQYDNFPCDSDGIFFDDISIEFVERAIISSSSASPMWIASPGNTRKITLNAGNSTLLSFELNATGPTVSSYLIYATASSISDPNINTQSNFKNMTITEPLDLNVTFIPTTPINGANQNFSWIFVNVTAYTNNLDRVILNFDGVNETINCIGIGPTYNCKTNKTSLPNGVYDIKVYVRDIYNRINSTETRTIFIGTAAPIIDLSPTNRTKIFQNKSITLEFNSSQALSFVGFYINNDTSTLYNMTNITATNWRYNLGIPEFDLYNIEYIYNDTASNQYNITDYYFFYLKNSSQKVFKIIKGSTNDSYNVTLEIINYRFNQSSFLYDYIPDHSTTSNFSILYDYNRTLLGPKFFGKYLLWNLSLIDSQNFQISYLLNTKDPGNIIKSNMFGFE